MTSLSCDIEALAVIAAALRKASASGGLPRLGWGVASEVAQQALQAFQDKHPKPTTDPHMPNGPAPYMMNVKPTLTRRAKDLVDHSDIEFGEAFSRFGTEVQHSSDFVIRRLDQAVAFPSDSERSFVLLAIRAGMQTSLYESARLFLELHDTTVARAYEAGAASRDGEIACLRSEIKNLRADLSDARAEAHEAAHDDRRGDS